MLNLILCDDIEAHNRTLELMLRPILEKKEIPFRLPCITTRAEDVIRYAREHPEPAIYFLDICLNEKDPEQSVGIDLCGRVLEHSPGSCVIYVSAFLQFALVCCQSHAFDFLIKPFDELRLESCLDAAIAFLRVHSARDTLTVQAGSRTIRLNADELLYIENSREYCVAHTDTGTTVWRESFASLLERLGPSLIRIHRSYIVNADRIEEYNAAEDTVLLTRGTVRLPVSRRLRAGLPKKLSQEGPRV